MKEITRISSQEWGTNAMSLSSFIRNIEVLKKERGVEEEIYFWPEIYKTYDFDKMDENNLSATPVNSIPVLVIGIRGS